MRTSDTGGTQDLRNTTELVSATASTSTRTPARGRDRLHLNLRQAVQHIGSSDSLESVVRQLMSTIQSVFHCDTAVVYLIDGRKHQILPYVQMRSSRETDNPGETSATTDVVPAFPSLRLDDCCQRLQLSPFRWPSNENRPARDCALFDTLQDAGFSTWFSVPLRVGKQTIGFIAVGYFHYQYLFDDASQVLWEFAQDVTKALLPHLPGSVAEVPLESQDPVDLPSLYQQERMRRLLTNHHELTNTLWSDDKLSSILESLSFIVHQPVALLDSFLHPLTTYPADVLWDELLPSVQHWMAQRQNESRVHLPLSVRTDAIHGESVVITPVQMGTAVLGYVVVWERGTRLDDLDVMALQQSATILAVHFYKHGLHVERLGHGFSELLSKLLDNPGNWNASNTAEALDVGWNVTAKQYILVGKPNSPNDINAVVHEALQGYLDKLRIRLATDYPTVRVARYQNHFVFMLPNTMASRESVCRFIEWIRSIQLTTPAISSLKGDGKMHADTPDLSLSFGLSQVAQSPVEIAEAYTEAFTAASLFLIVGTDDSLLYADDIRVYLLLRPVSSLSATRNLVDDLLRPLEVYDLDHQTELLKTLRAYLQHNGNLTDAAQALFIHRTSLQYRLGRIEGLISRHLEDARTRLELQLALVFRDLERAFPSP